MTNTEPLTVTARIRALEAGENIVLKGRPEYSVRAIVSRLRHEFKGKRTYHTKTSRGTIQVWRLQ